MEELSKIRKAITAKKYDEALLLIDDLEEMGKKGIRHNIKSYCQILLLHLIMQQLENRSTRSWEISILNSVEQIQDLNHRGPGKKDLFNVNELKTILDESLPGTIRSSSLEVFEGSMTAKEIEQSINKNQILQMALALIQNLDSEQDAI